MHRNEGIPSGNPRQLYFLTTVFYTSAHPLDRTIGQNLLTILVRVPPVLAPSTAPTPHFDNFIDCSSEDDFRNGVMAIRTHGFDELK
jgi:hypothetical protein